MEQIIVTKANGKTLTLLRRDPACWIARAKQSKKLLGEDTVTLSIESLQPVDFQIGDSITVFGETYVLNLLPAATRKGETRFSYELVFEGEQYSLIRVLYFNQDVSGFNTSAEFTLTGDLAMFAGVLINNLNRVFPGVYTFSSVPTGTATKTLTFSNENCLAVLQKLCQEYSTEFSISRSGATARTLTLGTIGQILPDTFAYGRGRGLYELSRETVKENGFITRLYAFGGTRNLASSYRDFSPRLRMDTPGSFIENALAKKALGLIEGSKIWEDIYPHRTGTVTGAVAMSASDSTFTFIDAAMDFNLSAETGTVQQGSKTVKQYQYILGGVAPKVHFNSGGLAGYEFEVNNYDHATKTFTLIPYKDERGMQFPSPTSSAFQLSPGDTYVLLDITMPETYVLTAEAQLKAVAEDYLAANSAPRVQYGLTVDEGYLSRRQAVAGTLPDAISNVFGLGDYLTVKDAELGIDGASRIIGLDRDVLNPYKYELSIADTYQISLIERILAEQADTRAIIRINDLRDPARARQSWKTTQELLNMVFDPDDYFSTERIKPNSVETNMLVVGAKSQQFVLNCVIEPNFEGNANVVKINTGRLTHYTVEEQIRSWPITADTVTLTSTAARYIYAKCGKPAGSITGNLLFSTQQIKSDADPLFYHFLIGVIHAVDPVTKVRWINLTYGATAINGRFIKTGRIQSFDGDTYFDLDSGEIGGKITFLSADGTRKDVSAVEIDDRAFIDSVIEDLGTQKDGKIESFYQNAAPVWSTNPVRALHEGDTWYKLSSGVLYRFNSATNRWIENTNARSVAAHAIALKNDNLAYLSRTTFGAAAPPFAPYVPGDYWVNGQTLLRCIVGRLDGEDYDPLDWVPLTHYDDTVTTIDGGIVTSGRVQLAGSGGSVKAGITGEGITDASVRVWAGADYDNRGIAPFRVLQSGEAFARKRIEMMSSANVGQAGICGQNVSADGPVRMWAGSPYADRNTAPFRVESDGSMTATKGSIGSWVIQGDGIVNDDGQAYIIARSTTASRRTEARIGANVFPATYGGKGAAQFVATEKGTLGEPNYAAVFQADGGVGNDGDDASYAIYAQWGIAHLGKALINGRRYLGRTVSNVNLLVDPSKYDVIELYPTGTTAGLKFVTPTSPLGYGKQIVIMNTNDSMNNFHVTDIVRGTSDFIMKGGSILTLIYTNGYWYVMSAYDNNFGSAGAPFVDPPSSNPKPTVVTPFPDKVIQSEVTETFTVPKTTFADPGDILTYGALSADSSPLPTGISFNRNTLTYTVLDTVPTGDYLLKTIAVDSDSQTAADTFKLSVYRNGATPPPVDPGNPSVGSSPVGQVVTSGTATYDGEQKAYIITETN